MVSLKSAAAFPQEQGVKVNTFLTGVHDLCLEFNILSNTIIIELTQ